jgi:hypothetical protein
MYACRPHLFSRLLCSLPVCLSHGPPHGPTQGQRHAICETTRIWNGHSDNDLSAFPPILINDVFVLLFAKAWVVHTERSNSWTMKCSKPEPLHIRMKNCLPSHAKPSKNLGPVNITPSCGASTFEIFG